MTDFDDERVIGEALQKRGEVRDGFGRAVERERELEKHSAEFSGGSQNVEAGAHGALVFFRGGDFAG